MGAALNGDICAADLDLLNIPLREFINFVPQEKMVYYRGSITEPPCSETVTWIVNMQPHVITMRQVDQLNSLLREDLQYKMNEDLEGVGGNVRDI